MMDSGKMVNIINDLIEKNLAKDIFRLAEITATSSNGVRVKFDGETVASTKYYPIIDSGQMIGVGDRVLMGRIKGSYAVFGKVSSGALSSFTGHAKVYPYGIYGDGIAYGMGGRTIIGGGESATALMEYLGVYGTEELHLASDNNVFVETNMQAGGASRYTWTFRDDGLLDMTKFKYVNGYNMTATRANIANDGIMLIQSMTGAGINLASGEMYDFTTVTWPVAFDVVPEWCAVTSRDANSIHAHFAVYNLTTTGCTLYANRQQSTANTSNYNPNWQIVVCGKRGG